MMKCLEEDAGVVFFFFKGDRGTYAGYGCVRGAMVRGVPVWMTSGGVIIT